MSVNDDQQMSNEMDTNGLSELRDDPSNFYFQELQSAHVKLFNERNCFLYSLDLLFRLSRQQ